MPGHSPTVLPTQPVTAQLSASLDAAGPDVGRERAVWLLVAALIAAGLPVPYTFGIYADGEFAILTMSTPGDVTVWAQALGAVPPTVRTFPHSGKPGVRITTTRTDLDRSDGSRLTIEHLVSETIPATSADDVTAGAGGREVRS